MMKADGELEHLIGEMIAARERAAHSQTSLAKCEVTIDGVELFSRKTINAVENFRRPPTLELVEFYERHCAITGGRLRALFERFKQLAGNQTDGPVPSMRPSLAAVNIMVRVTSIDELRNSYRITYEQVSYTKPSVTDQFLYAVCETNALVDLLETTAAMVTSTTPKPDSVSLDAFTKEIARSSRVAGYERRGKATSRAERTFTPLSEQETAELLDGVLESRDLDLVRVLAADLAGLHAPFTTTTIQELHLNPHLWFWAAEQPMFCERVEIDLSDLDDASQQSSRTITFFPKDAGLRDDYKDEPRHGKHILSVESRIEPGHGFVVYWTPSRWIAR